MARDHARLRLDMGGDDDWRALTHDAQWLYYTLLAHPSLNLLGIADWRAARLAAVTAELQAPDVDVFADELETARFILVDRDSEEVLIRSFVKHDGLLRSPNMVKAMVKEWVVIASRVIRCVAVEQVRIQHEKRPTLAGWTGIGNLLTKPSMTFEDGFAELHQNPSPNPSVNGSGNPSTNPSVKGSATPILPSSYPPFLPSKSNHPASSEQGTSGFGQSA